MKGKILFQIADLFLDHVDLNEEILFGQLLGEICLNRIEGLAYIKLRNKKGEFPKEFIQTLENVYTANQEENKKYKQSLKELARIFEQASFDYAFLKGSILITKIYEEGIRRSNDVDILINESSITECQNLLISNGFVQGFKVGNNEIRNATRKEIIISRMNYGETVPFVKKINGEVLVVDLNFSLDYKPEIGESTVKKMLDKKVELNYEDVKLCTLQYIDFLIHLCCHLYKEATTFDWIKRNRDLQLYKFSDINILINLYINDDNVGKLVGRIIELGVVKECYYAFANSLVIFPNLSRIEAFNKLLSGIHPESIEYMKQIVDPKNNNIFEYRISFEEWFNCDNRKAYLYKIGEKNEF